MRGGKKNRKQRTRGRVKRGLIVRISVDYYFPCNFIMIFIDMRKGGGGQGGPGNWI
jgi:hypothetical protein